MIKSKITNISSVKIELFIKVHNSYDILVAIKPGDVVFSDGGEPTRSMRVFERKNLISIIKDDFDSVSIKADNKILRAIWHADTTEHLKNFHGVDAHIDMEQVLKNELNQNMISDVIDSENTYKDLTIPDLMVEDEISTLDEAKKQAESYVDETSEGSLKKEKKKYNYKKKPGRKKKRGPKPGSKRKKENNA